jgi:TRAP-type C4-dicarboxylate transport system substrate-binding protein
MKRIKLLGIIVLGVLFLGSIFMAPGDAWSAPKTIKWKMQYHIPNTAPIGPYGPNMFHWAIFKKWADIMTKATEGQLQFEWLEPNAAFPDQEGLSAVGSGIVEACFTQPSYFIGQIPEQYVANGLPLAWDSVDEMYDAWYNYRLIDKMAPLFEKRGVVMFPTMTMEYMNIHANFPAPGPEAVKGKKVRTWGQWGDYIKMLGGAPVPIPYAETYMALKLGTVDGAWTGAQSLETHKLKEVVKHFVTNKTGAINAILINKKAFDTLPSNIKTLIHEATPSILTTGCLDLIQHQSYAIGKAVNEGYIKTWQWSASDMQKVRQQAIKELWPALVKKGGSLGPEIMQIITKQLKDHGKIN